MMAASVLCRACVTLRAPSLAVVSPIRLQRYSAGPLVPGSAVGRKRRPGQKSLQRREVPPPRTEKMAPDQEWSNVYPTAASFKPSAVPLPVRMGYPKKKAAPPDKIGNLELLKIPNFLHLTPAAIKKHCFVLKEFCTPWPAALNSDDACTKHFPLEFQSVDYLSAGPSLRNPKARVVTLKFKVSSLNLDDHAKKKLLRLVGDRYNAKDDIITIVVNRCPLRKQNEDYAMYLLAVLFHESWKKEAWENEREEADQDEYVFEGSDAEEKVVDLLSRMHRGSLSREEILQLPSVQQYRQAMLNLYNNGETEESIAFYGESVKNMLNVK